MFADWRRIALPVASFSEEEVKEVKGLVVSPYTSLQFLELELDSNLEELAIVWPNSIFVVRSIILRLYIVVFICLFIVIPFKLPWMFFIVIGCRKALLKKEKYFNCKG